MGVPYAEVIGDPIAHSKSPLIHKFWLEKLGLEGDYCRTRVTEVELEDYFRSRRDDPDWRGCNVTMPLKQAVVRHLDHVDPTAQRIGAVNTVLSRDGLLRGLNTDWQGLKPALGGWSPAGADVVLIGAGGAARAALEALSRTRPRRLILMNRSLEKAAALLEHFELEGEVRPIGDPPPVDLVLNASALGMKGYPPLGIDLSALPADAIIFDMVYLPLETELLKQARRRGLRTVDGLAMLTWQASRAFGLFFDHAPTEVDTPKLRERLAA